MLRPRLRVELQSRVPNDRGVGGNLTDAASNRETREARPGGRGRGTPLASLGRETLRFAAVHILPVHVDDTTNIGAKRIAVPSCVQMAGPPAR